MHAPLDAEKIFNQLFILHGEDDLSKLQNVNKQLVQFMNDYKAAKREKSNDTFTSKNFSLITWIRTKDVFEKFESLIMQCSETDASYALKILNNAKGKDLNDKISALRFCIDFLEAIHSPITPYQAFLHRIDNITAALAFSLRSPNYDVDPGYEPPPITFKHVLRNLSNAVSSIQKKITELSAIIIDAKKTALITASEYEKLTEALAHRQAISDRLGLLQQYVALANPKSHTLIQKQIDKYTENRLFEGDVLANLDALGQDIASATKRDIDFLTYCKKNHLQ